MWIEQVVWSKRVMWIEQVVWSEHALCREQLEWMMQSLWCGIERAGGGGGGTYRHDPRRCPRRRARPWSSESSRAESSCEPHDVPCALESRTIELPALWYLRERQECVGTGNRVSE
jgi:hypothetical protein